MSSAFRFSLLVAVLAAAGCGSDDPSSTCMLDGESCDPYAFYKVTQDRPLFQEPGPNGYMLLVRARLPSLGSAYFEYAEQGRKTGSGVETITLDDPRGASERPYPPLAQLLVGPEHPRGVEGSIHWYGWGEVERDIDFESERVRIRYGPMTFLNQQSGEEWVFDSASDIEVDLDVLCWDERQEPLDRNSDFCRSELP